MATVYVVVYFFLVAEMLLCAILLLPMPQKPTDSFEKIISLFNAFEKGRTGSIGLLFVLGAFFLVDLSESWKYRSLSQVHRSQQMNPTHLQEYWQDQAQYFRAQRNSYLSGFSIFMLLLLYRVIVVVSHMFHEQNKADVLAKQALGQQESYKKLIDEHSALKKNAGDVNKAKLSEEALKKQSENNIKVLEELAAENKRLRNENDRLMNQLTQKEPAVKKND